MCGAGTNRDVVKGCYIFWILNQKSCIIVIVNINKERKDKEMGLTFVKRYPNYNPRRFGTPWIAIVNPKNGRLDFSKRVGGYSGLPGEQGDLYLFDPVEGCVYAYGQKDYSHPTPKRTYVLYTNGTLEEVKSTELLQVLKENTIVL